MRIRPYKQKDKIAVMRLLDCNTPNYFDESERGDFIHYLNCEVEEYFVVERENEIIGAGGVNYFQAERVARISWDMIHPKAQGKGVGRLLLEYRLEHVGKNDGIDRIVVRTTQLVSQFYEKMGFNLIKVEKDFWAPGFDLYQMEQENKKSVTKSI